MKHKAGYSLGASWRLWNGWYAKKNFCALCLSASIPPSPPTLRPHFIPGSGFLPECLCPLLRQPLLENAQLFLTEEK